MRLNWILFSQLIVGVVSGEIADSSLVSPSLPSADTFQQPSSKNPSLSVVRNLTWGDVNFLHTTDTHGWLPGHILEPQFSADWGDYLSFLHHMRRRADELGTDLIVVDTGDRHDGNGLSDATYPNGVLSQEVFMHADIDILTIGNHELYKAEVAQQEKELIAPHYKEKYLTSNVDILWDGSWQPVGNQYLLFETKNLKLKTLAFGFLFNFKGNSANTRVRLVQHVVKEEWFQDAIRTPGLDLIVIAGHIPVRYFTEFAVIINEIRTVLPNIPIQGLGGHTHIRDYVIFDDNAAALESGRFLETVGWASIQNVRESKFDDVEHVMEEYENVSESQTSSSDKEQVSEHVPQSHVSRTFSRSYIDFNLHSLSIHSNTSLTDPSNSFHTEDGQKLSTKIASYRELLNLTETYGCVPQNYYTSRSKYPGPENLFSLLENVTLPLLVGHHVPERVDLPRYVIVNTGSVRFDMFKGPFSKDSGYIISPFSNNWLYMPSVPVNIASKILPALNRLKYIVESELDYNELGVPSERVPSFIENSLEHDSNGHISDHHHSDSQQTFNLLDAQASNPLFPGYVTHDDLGKDGDDSIHNAWPEYYLPNAIQAEQNISDDPNLEIDVVFYDFIKPFITDALQRMGHGEITDNIYPYGGLSVADLLKFHVQNAWICEDENSS